MQAVAECLAGLVYVNALAPGHPVIFGTWPFVSDLRTGAMSGGSGEQALLTAGCAQMHQFYGLPGGAAAGIADAKLPDMQAGWEQAISNVMAGLSGLNLIYECAGMHASLLGFCMESLILGDDLIGQALRCVRGIEVDDDTLSLAAMREVCLGGPGHYLGHASTLRPDADRLHLPGAGRPHERPRNGSRRTARISIAKATERKLRLLARPVRAAFDPATDRGDPRRVPDTPRVIPCGPGDQPGPRPPLLRGGRPVTTSPNPGRSRPGLVSPGRVPEPHPDVHPERGVVDIVPEPLKSSNRLVSNSPPTVQRSVSLCSAPMPPNQPMSVAAVPATVAPAQAAPPVT